MAPPLTYKVLMDTYIYLENVASWIGVGSAVALVVIACTPIIKRIKAAAHD